MIESETLDEVALIGSRLILSSDQIFILYRYGNECYNTFIIIFLSPLFKEFILISMSSRMGINRHKIERWIE